MSRERAVLEIADALIVTTTPRRVSPTATSTDEIMKLHDAPRSSRRNVSIVVRSEIITYYYSGIAKYLSKY